VPDVTWRGLNKPRWVDEYRTGSGSDRVQVSYRLLHQQAMLEPASLLTISRLESGRYRSRFRICAAFVEW